MYDKYLKKWNGFDLVPIDKEDLYELVRDCPTNADLNFLDVSEIIDMSGMFRQTDFNGQIENWDVSNVENMEFMFCDSEFNQPIGNWDTSCVENMEFMFCYSKFNQPIGNWNMFFVEEIGSMFIDSEFKSDIPKHNMTPIEFVNKTKLMITQGQLQHNHTIQLKQWCEKSWMTITTNELYINIFIYYVYNIIEDEEEQFDLIAKYNLTQFEI